MQDTYLNRIKISVRLETIFWALLTLQSAPTLFYESAASQYNQKVDRSP